MIQIININSDNKFLVQIDVESIIPKLSFLIHKAKKIPVYLVNEELMDKIYPPEKRVTIDEEFVSHLLSKYREREEDFDNLTKIFEEIRRKEIDPTEVFIAVGVYVHTPLDEDLFSIDYIHEKYLSLTEDKEEIINEYFYKKYSSLIKYPAIFICPERVFDWARKHNISFNLLFQKVYFHELGHAYIHNPRRDYNKLFYRIIEESFCNALALNRFDNEKDKAALIPVIHSQPTEYKGYTFFEKAYNLNLSNPLFYKFPLYIYDKKYFIEEYEYLIHRWFHMLRHEIERMGFYPLIPFILNISDERAFKELWDSKVDDDYFKILGIYILKEITGN